MSWESFLLKHECPESADVHSPSSLTDNAIARDQHSNKYAGFPEAPSLQPQPVPPLPCLPPAPVVRLPTHTKPHRHCDAHAWARSIAVAQEVRRHPAILPTQKSCYVTLKPVLQAVGQS